MSKMGWFGIAITLFIICFAFQIDTTVLNASMIDNRDAVKQASEASIQRSINKGTLRVTESVEIDPVAFSDEYEKFYKENVDFNYEGSTRNFRVVKVNTSPAMVAVEGEVTNKSTFKRTTEEKNEDISLLFKNVVIYESKSKVKIPGGNVE
ncbi:hypothetical protein [Exiguobacterium sp. RIT594]|uniref:hypothetical protein n=1 Tax=Exiguobacterium sp. RIT594 TaxID=2282449 RepID=UPI000DF8094E|nr:hypothetical protein [Exiguobacterium sp. RIT594]RDB32090.1 hypothetical protein DVG79_15045 [Exiguobacterium sp. RIT594]